MTEVVIGRGRSAGFALDDPLVSRRHALVGGDPESGAATITDLGSSNGTFVNGRRIEGVTPIGVSDRIAVGNATLRWTAGGVVLETASPTVIIAARNVFQTARDTRALLLDDLTLEVKRAEFVALVGASGSGKTTLLEVLGGVRAPTTGTIEIDGYAADRSGNLVRTRLGFVATRSSAHPALTVASVLQHSARVRLSSDATAAERSARVDEVMTRLGLADLAAQRVATLSDGQRKRLDLAMELIGLPQVLILDEPTSGLDPGTERLVMETLRQLADRGHTVIISTHSTNSLQFCDRVIALRAGRELLTWDPASGRTQADWLVHQLGTGQVIRRAAPRTVRSSKGRAVTTSPVGRYTQWRALIAREVAILVADRARLVRRVSLAPVVGLVLMAVVGDARLRATGVVGEGGIGGQFGAPNVLLAIVLAAGFVGVITASRAICDDAAFLASERRAGMSLATYLGARVAMPFAHALADGALIVVLAVARAGPPSRGVIFGSGTAELALTAALCGAVGVLLGVAISAWSEHASASATALPALLVPSFLLAGLAFPLDNPIVRVASLLNPTQWGLAAASSTVDVPRLVQCENNPFSPYADRCVPEWRHTTASLLTSWSALIGLGVVFVVLALAGLGRRTKP